MVASDLSDSWLMGMASDPVKTMRVRAVHRAYADWLAADGARAAEPAFRNFSRQFVKAGEHTWGLSGAYLGKALRYAGWANADFHAGVRRGDPRVISDCHFRKTATEYDRKPGIKWLSCTAK